MEKSGKKKVSIVISAYNEEDNVQVVYDQVVANLKPLHELDYEIIFVNDGSNDNTLEILRNIVLDDKRVIIVNLLRNFGHEIAMTAGLDHSSGDCVLFMDADLQHPPSLVPVLIGKWLEGYYMVLTKRTDNVDQSFLNKILGLIFYKILNFLSDIKIPAQAPDFRLIDKKYVDALKRMKENNRMFRGLISWLGESKQCVIDFKAPQRNAGKTKYNMKNLFRLAIDSVVSFSIRPLQIATYIGLTTAMISIMLGIYFVYDFFTSTTYKFTGFGTTVVMVIFIGSVQLIFLGIIGEYIGRIHLEVKNRPLYVSEIIANAETADKI
jgi:polyisoprenyl-phosphate glycosyltransferase